MFSNQFRVRVFYLCLFMVYASVYAMNPSQKEYKTVMQQVKKTLNVVSLKAEPVSFIEGGYKITTPQKKQYFLFFRALKPKSELLTYVVLVDSQKKILYFRFIDAPLCYGTSMGRKRWARKRIGQYCASPQIEAVSGATLSVNGLQKDLKEISTLIPALVLESNH